ncbi:hypothetical protein BY458DRAFT_544012 [Sporodiniella umbellata]|nr:hypothetical protein BY458DRAFT_544012 [Sporodiniella umbellata]
MEQRKKVISKYARPISFVAEKKTGETFKPFVDSNREGERVASLYQSIVHSTKPSTMKQAWCERCALAVTDYSQHLQSITHQLSSTTDVVDPLVLSATNVGFHMVRAQGWQYHQGLGKQNQGKRHPIATAFKQDRACLGQSKPPQKRITHPPPAPAAPSSVFPTAKQRQKRAKKESLQRTALLYYLKE